MLGGSRERQTLMSSSRVLSKIRWRFYSCEGRKSIPAHLRRWKLQTNVDCFLRQLRIMCCNFLNLSSRVQSLLNSINSVWSSMLSPTCTMVENGFRIRSYWLTFRSGRYLSRGSFKFLRWFFMLWRIRKFEFSSTENSGNISVFSCFKSFSHVPIFSPKAESLSEDVKILSEGLSARLATSLLQKRKVGMRYLLTHLGG